MNSANARCFFSREDFFFSLSSFLFFFGFVKFGGVFPDVSFPECSFSFSLLFYFVLSFRSFLIWFSCFPLFVRAFGADFLFSFSALSGVNCLCGLVVRTLHSGTEEARVLFPAGAFSFHFLSPSFRDVVFLPFYIFLFCLCFHCGFLEVVHVVLFFSVFLLLLFWILAPVSPVLFQ